MKNDCNRNLQVKTLMYGLERELFLMDAFDLFLFLFDSIRIKSRRVKVR